MKSKVALLTIAVLIAFAFATDVTLEAKKLRTNLYADNYGDTIPVATGHAKIMYLDTAGSPDKGISEDNFSADSIAVLIFGYGDADTTQARVDIDESYDGNTTFINMIRDTIVFPSTSAYGEIFYIKKHPGATLRVVVRGYGTTDNSNLLGIRAWGE